MKKKHPISGPYTLLPIAELIAQPLSKADSFTN